MTKFNLDAIIKSQLPKGYVKKNYNKNKRRYVNIYGRKVCILIKKTHNFYFGRLQFSKKILAFSHDKSQIPKKCSERLEKIFEKCAINNDFTIWNLTTGATHA